MFLPRSSPSLGSSSSSSSSSHHHLHSSSAARSSESAGRTAESSMAPSNATGSDQSYPSKRSGVHHIGGGAWSQPTTAPASVQVHYHYLAGRYRDLSSEKGLGLVHSGIPSSTSNATLGGIPEADRGEEGEESQDGSVSIHSTASRSKSASNSLRAIARKSGLKGEAGEAIRSSSSRRMDDLFLGGKVARERRQNGLLGSSKAGVANIRATGECSKGSGGPHGQKHGSLRSYAEERIKAHELVEARVQRATDTGRLKWEAKAAMLNNSFGLAILLFTRAAQLGSVSASLSLSHLYATGTVRGSRPVVVLVFRDPLRALSWALEAARLLQHRTQVKAKRRGDSSLLAWADTEQPSQIIALFSRLLRCKQAGITSLDEVRLPNVRRAKAGREKPETTLLWAAVCEAMSWLDLQLPPIVQPVRDDGESMGPDDDELDPGVIRRVQTRTQIALIKALVATRQVAVGEQEDEKGLSKAQECWANFASQLHDEACPHLSQQGDLLELCQLSEKLLSGKKRMGEALSELKAALDKSIVESATPVASSPHAKLASLESPSKRRAGQLLRRGVSLEDLKPMDAESQRAKEQSSKPALLKHHAHLDSKATASVTDVQSTAMRSHLRPGRAISLQGNAQRPTLPASATLARLEIIAAPATQRERTTLQRVRRPSSVMSDSPSLLFNTSTTRDDAISGDAAQVAVDEGPVEESGMPKSISVASSLWEAAPRRAPGTEMHGEEGRRRVSSLYGNPSVAPSEKITSEGCTTYDYDIEASLRRQQARRRRGDSNASISTVASFLSSNPSMSESMAESEYAKGHFSAPFTTNTINGYDLRMGGAADTLRRIRKTSCTAPTSSRDGPTAPQLTETLEQLIANSTSYKAVNAKAPQQPPNRSRKNSNASMRSLTAFTSNNQRQSSRGEMRPPSLFRTGRSVSVLAMPTTLTDRSHGHGIRSPTLSSTASFLSPTAGVTSTLSSSSAMSTQTSHGAAAGALGSLRLLGWNGNVQGSRKPIPTFHMDGKESKTGTASNPPLAFPSSFSHSSSKDNSNAETLPGKELAAPVNRRTFASIDPTHSGAATPKTLHSTSPPLSRTSSSSHDVVAADHGASNGLDPALAEAEEKSGLKTTSTCMSCGRKVINAPVSKSGDVFCSRDCRIELKKKRMASAGVSQKGKAKETDVVVQ